MLQNRTNTDPTTIIYNCVPITCKIYDDTVKRVDGPDLLLVGFKKEEKNKKKIFLFMHVT